MANAHSGTLRIGFIGAGGIAATQMQALMSRADVRIVAIADLDAAALETRGQAFCVEARYTDYRRMLRESDLDAVSICTPNKAHATATLDALRAGLHVLCEKPMAHSAAAAARMAETAETLGRKLVIGFQYRFNPRTQFLRNAVDKGDLGRILFGRVQAMRRRGIPNWGVFGRKELQGGGPLIDIGVHVLEMTHYTMGSPTPVSASADMFTYLGNQPSDRVQSVWQGWDWKTYDVEDLAVGRIRFDNGAVLHIESCFAAHIEKDTFNFQLMGSEGGCTWDPARIFRDEGGYMVDKVPGWLSPKTSWQDMFNAKMHAFVDHVLYDQPTIAPARDGLAVQKMLDALYRSAERGGREVAIR
ncbi:MAG: Gfo/Idh/MocA family oxidoreductase [Pseudomonadales bacterium]|nr:Gfo/Idh/MocA family oxidoreductase [Pseudomonadales bacterium]